MLGKEPERFQEIEGVFTIDKIIDAEGHCYDQPSSFCKNACGRFDEAIWSSQVFKHFAHHDCVNLQPMKIPRKEITIDK